MYFYWGSHLPGQKCQVDFGGQITTLWGNNTVLHLLYSLVSFETLLKDIILFNTQK